MSQTATFPIQTPSAQPETTGTGKPTPLWKGIACCFLLSGGMVMCSSGISFGVRQWFVGNELKKAQKENAEYIAKIPQGTVTKIFRDEATNETYAVDVPVEKLLERTEAKIERQKKKLNEKFFDNWYYIAAIAMVGGLGFSSLYAITREKEPKPAT